MKAILDIRGWRKTVTIPKEIYFRGFIDVPLESPLDFTVTPVQDTEPTLRFRTVRLELNRIERNVPVFSL